MTDTSGTNVQNNDTLISQEEAIGAGLWWANARISMSQLPSSPHLDYFTFLLLLGAK